MPHHTSLIAILCMGFVLAFLFGALARRLKLSPLVGYLVAGIVAGPYTPGFVGDQQLAPQLAEIGVILLMFGVGLHFSWRDLMSVKAIALPGAVAQITAATLLGWAMGHYWLGWSHGASIVFGLSLSCASTVVLLRAMEDHRLLETERGRIAVGWLIVEDLACVVALVLMPAMAGLMGGQAVDPASGEVVKGSIWSALFLTLFKVGAFMAVMLVVGRRVIPWILGRVAGMGSRELFTLCVLAIALGVAFGSAELFGVSFALGAFFAGMLLAESEFSHEAAEETLPLRDAFAVLFFVSVGMLFDPRFLLDHALEVLAVVGIIVLGKSAVAYLIVRAFGKSDRTALTISASLAQIGEFSFILAALGVGLKILPEDGHDLILSGALISIMLNPLIFNVLNKLLASREAARAPVEPIVQRLPDDLAGHALVVGYGRVGLELSKLLVKRGVPMVVVEEDGDRVARARKDGLLAVRGNATSEAVLEEARARQASLAIVAVPQALEAAEIVTHLKKLSPGITVLARAHSESGVALMLERGADAAVLAERELAYSLAEMVMATPPYRPARVEAVPASP
ncbi:MAG: Kef family K(+) transporter [Lysobacteraceae bacterium]|nr:MAG: Kef family K(+) transporter [Xanthomonadaceae bacterium]